MKKKYILFLILLLAISCGRLAEERDNYVIEDYFTGNNCNIYKMIFDNGSYIFRMSLAGSCDSLLEQDFIAEYERFYSSNDTIFKKKGEIIVEYYDEMNWDKEKIANALISITQKHSGGNVTCSFDNEDSYWGTIILEVR